MTIENATDNQHDISKYVTRTELYASIRKKVIVQDFYIGSALKEWAHVHRGPLISCKTIIYELGSSKHCNNNDNTAVEIVPRPPQRD